MMRAFRHSWRGLVAAYHSERAFRIELALTLFVFPAAFWLGENLQEYVILIGSWFFVLMMELVNTAIETIINRISREHHVDSGKAKDIGSAIVFLSAIQAAFFWLFILIKKML